MLTGASFLYIGIIYVPKLFKLNYSDVVEFLCSLTGSFKIGRGEGGKLTLGKVALFLN